MRDLVSVLEENSSKFSGSNCLIVGCQHNQRISGECLEKPGRTMLTGLQVAFSRCCFLHIVKTAMKVQVAGEDR